MKRHTLIVLALFLTTLWANATEAYSLITYNVEAGLSSNTVNCIAQDELGYIWAGTNNGIDRFDGYRFHHYALETPIICLFCDSDGTLWIGSDNGLYSYDSDTDQMKRFDEETAFKVNISARINVIKENRSGKLLIGTKGQGLFLYDKSTGLLEQHSHYATMVTAIALNQDGRLLVGSEEGEVSEADENGVFIRTLHSEKTSAFARNTAVTSLYLRDEELWFSMENNELFLYDLSQETCEKLQLHGESVPGSISCLHYMDKEHLMIGASNGVYAMNFSNYSIERIVNGDDQKDLLKYDVQHIFSDRTGGIWVSTKSNGIVFLSKSLIPFKDHFSGNSIQSITVSAFCKQPDGTIWVSTINNGIYRISQNMPELFESRISDPECLLYVEGKLWIGTESNGIYILDVQTKELKNYRHNRYDATSLSDNNINVLYQDSKGRIIIGTEWGLNYYDKKNDCFIYDGRSSNKASISDIIEDSRGNLWITTHNAKSSFRIDLNGQVMNVFVSWGGDIASEKINCVFEDTAGSIWFGSTDGLFLFNYTDNLFSKPQLNGDVLEGKCIQSIEQDNSGHLWISATFGLFCINLKDGEVKEYNKADGLACYMFGEQTSLATDDGSLYFGGIDGFQSFKPQEFHEPATNNKIVITEILVNNRPIALHTTSTKLALKYSQNNISVSFSDLSYESAYQKRFLYMLEGKDKEWIKAGPIPTASYNNLSPGKYRLIVQNASSYGTNNQVELLITIHRPFYTSFSAIILYILILGSILYLVFRLIKKKREESTYLAEIQFFTNITHEIRTPLTLIKTPLEKILESGDGSAKTKSYLQVINKSTDSLLDLINQMLDFRKAEEEKYTLNKTETNIQILLSDIAGRFYPLCEAEGKTLTCDLGREAAFYSIDANAISKVVSNLLSNALKYANEKISLILKTQPDHFSIQVVNDGVEIKKSEQTKIFKMFYQIEGSRSGTGIGLPLAKLLTEKHDGNLSVTSDRYSTSFELNIPSQRKAEPEPVTTPPIMSEQEAATDELEEKLSVLIVEDNTDLRLFIAEMIKEKYHVIQAGNGKEGIDKMNANSVDIIVCDVMMPEMNGYEFCEYIRADIRYSNIPIILVTAKSSVEEKIQGIEFGADDYIIKPFSPDYLMTRIKNLLESRKRLMEYYRQLPVGDPSHVKGISKGDISFIRKLNEEMEKNMTNENFYIGSLAGKMFMSQSSLYRKISTLLGVSPNEYMKQFRLRKAAEMLSSREASIRDVFIKAGFSSNSYFSACFKKQYGETPSQYMERISGEKETEPKDEKSS